MPDNAKPPLAAGAGLVGRDREQRILSERLADALAGRGGLALISGAAGIGKTALAESLAGEAAAQGALVLTGRGYDLTETSPYGPWVDLFGRYPPTAGLPPPPAPFAARGFVGAIASQAALAHQVLDWCAALVAARPLVLLLDDLHWADAPSLDLLRTVARAVRVHPLLIVGIYRADEITREHPFADILPLLVREVGVTRLELRPLAPEAVRSLVAARFPLAPADAARLVGYLQARAEGNPFYLGELLRTLEEEGILREVAAGWEVGDVAAVPVPVLLRQVIDRRVMRLGPAAQQPLARAAVIGQVVPFALWAALTGVGDEALLAVLDRAQAARVLEATADGTSVRFCHALIREAVYEHILPPRRRAWHRDVGAALAAQPRPDPDLVARHFQQAGAPEALDWLVRAGDRARLALDHRAAVDRYRAALALDEARGQGETPERGWLLLRLAHVLEMFDPPGSVGAAERAARIGAAHGDRALAAAATFQAGTSRSFPTPGESHSPIATAEAGLRALLACTPAEQARAREVGLSVAHATGALINEFGTNGRSADALRLAAGFAPDTLTSPYWRAGLLAAHAALGQPDAARAVYREAVAWGEREATFVDLSGIHRAALNHLIVPYHADRVAWREEVAAAAERAAVAAARVGLIERPALQAWSALLYLSGRWAEIEALAAAPAPGDGGYVLYMATMVGPYARARGDADRAWAQVRLILPDGHPTAPGLADAWAATRLQRLAARLALDAGDLPLARAWLDAHDRWLDWGGAVLGRAEGRLGWAEYAGAAADPLAARGHAEAALAHATAPRQPLALLAAHRLLGELATADARIADAQAHLDAALALADACAAPYERALTLLALAELRRAQGALPDARALLDAARALCLPLGAAPALARAAALDARLPAHSPTATGSLPGGLTAREAEILRLLAAGLATATIADRLSLSPRTVGTHLTAIYGKLGVASRGAAIRFALDHGLR